MKLQNQIGRCFSSSVYLFIFCLFVSYSQLHSAQAIITFDRCGSRFGDCLITYLHAKWLSYKTNIPLQCNYIGFPYVEKLVLFDKELDYSYTPHPDDSIRLTLSNLDFKPELPVCYFVPYFPEFKWEYHSKSPFNFKYLFEVDWKDPQFRSIVLEMICSKSPLQLTLPPQNKVSVAVHVREGGNFDSSNLQFEAPMKRPPMHFYSDALLEVVHLFNQQDIYFQIFTDATNPQAIVTEIKKMLPPHIAIELHYRTTENHEAINVLEDFFSLFHYDVLIRPESSYSLVPSLLKDYAVVINPKEASVFESNNERIALIDEMNITINEELYLLLIEKIPVRQ